MRGIWIDLWLALRAAWRAFVREWNWQRGLTRAGYVEAPPF